MSYDVGKKIKKMKDVVKKIKSKCEEVNKRKLGIKKKK
jgi:hypothetical protein